MVMGAGGEAGPKFGYTVGTKNGPENWAKLSPLYKLCGDGKRQSPIDIVTRQAMSAPNLDSLTRTYNATNATLVSNGEDITVHY
jgi:carbonic anhydrase